MKKMKEIKTKTMAKTGTKYTVKQIYCYEMLVYLKNQWY